MRLDTKYLGSSGVTSTLDASTLGLATNALRPQGFFSGELLATETVREALTSLHGVVVSDLKRRPRDRLAWRVWLAEQDQKFLLNLKMKSSAAKLELEKLEMALDQLNEKRRLRLGPFHAARRRYADYVVSNTNELNVLYDPVVTVHPDEVFFEAFSKDESSYARVGVSRSLFGDDGQSVFGTTNIDFSKALARHLERLRSYRHTRFDVGPGGVDVAVDGVVHKEAKIELPESWVNGFLQVQATMTMGLTWLTLAPIDLFNVLRALKQKKARISPKAVRFELIPGKRVRVVLEPWELPIDLSTTYVGAPGGVDGVQKAQLIRIWGRDRLQLLARLLPQAKSVRVGLAGFGLPSFWVLDLGKVTFTLGLSGWTDNDWTGSAAAKKGDAGSRFELLTRRLHGSPEELMRVYEALKTPRVAHDVDVAAAAGVSLERARSSLSCLSQVGRVTFDLTSGRYRHRDLFFDAFTLAEAKKAAAPSSSEAASPQAALAKLIFEKDNARIIARRPVPPDDPKPGYKLSGSVKGANNVVVRPQLHVDGDGNIITGSCTCAWHREHSLTRGPCEHLLALRLVHMRAHELV
ncbi:MAG: hypothetical protein Q8O67_12090 [Deltaproteobacteria bacterium]|nr:hypothetical protein [Deltaproteobacteria bacterium]